MEKFHRVIAVGVVSFLSVLSFSPATTAALPLKSNESNAVETMSGSDGSTTPADAHSPLASASINPNTQNTTPAGKAQWSGSWSGGATATFYPYSYNNDGKQAAKPSYVVKWNYDSCSAYTVGQELDVYNSNGDVVAAVTATTRVIKTNPC